MNERRPFAPTPRRRALARQAGLTAASPRIVGATAAIVAIVTTIGLSRAAWPKLAGWIAAACRGDHTLEPIRLPNAILELAAPLLGAAAAAALVAHLAQTRALWLPRRRIAGAPAMPRRAPALDLVATSVIGIVGVAWLWLIAPRLASLFELAPAPMTKAVGAALASAVVAFAIAWLALGVLDALIRHVDLARALAMTHAEKREDDRLAAADPRWRAQRLAIVRGSSASDAVARAAVVVLGDDVAVAITWDPVRQPTPLRTATGHRARATQLVGLARRHHVPVHREPDLAAALAANEGPVPETYWARVAEIMAALRNPRTRD